MVKNLKYTFYIEKTITYLCNSLKLTRKELAILFKNRDVSLRRLDNEIQIGVENGFSPDEQLEIFKDVFSNEITDFNFGVNI